jgi:hypothetical protein
MIRINCIWPWSAFCMQIRMLHFAWMSPENNSSSSLISHNKVNNNNNYYITPLIAY